MKKKIKIGIIGVGSISNVHIQSYQKIDSVEIAAFCDINEKQLKHMMDKYHVKNGYTSVEEMLDQEELDAVSVCTWNSGHAECSIAALNHGVNVLCEKPMAMNAEEALRMKQAAEKNGKLLMVGLVRRFGDDIQILRDLNQNKFFGDIYYVKSKYLRRSGSPGGWFSDKKRSGGGPLIDLGVHILDMMNYLLDCEEPVSVYGYTFDQIGDQVQIKKNAGYVSSTASSNIYDVEDFAGAVIRFSNNKIAVLETSYNLFIEHDSEGLELYGSEGGAKIDDGITLTNNVCDYMANNRLLIDSKFDFHKAFLKEIQHYINCITDKTECNANADDGIRNMKILDAVYQSAKVGHEVII
ncbi:Gfo/Idh/MocA family protein [Anaerocolumna xylanovorans]|uniref:Predicted dehydrogenase n=1 Tax=Anaerocolumna xylanovorans DSM 12503 TaxID=1121345 RepID=A0A1M7Y582_9FIRM|nr:Gfo/Idh/MocA family oxidoreductase [Anaerocolumna xylanovorans]SHO47571.1 Predicted dehydrogenase [Anaerocolumna xylanovorans DSM 12503]